MVLPPVVNGQFGVLVNIMDSKNCSALYSINNPFFNAAVGAA
jgi:hypothetical protein